MTPTEIQGPRDAAAALDEQLARSLRLMAPAVGALYVLWALVGTLRSAQTPTAVVAAAAFLALGVVLALRPVAPKLANPLLVGGLAVVAVEALVRGLTGSATLCLALAAAGAIALRPGWVLAASAAVLGPWLGASMLGLWGWSLECGSVPEIAAACVLASVLFEARHGAVAGLVNSRGALHALALTDPLTGLLNRRGIEEAATRLLAGNASDLSLLYLDLDDFKGINDRFGHAEGDTALRSVAGMLLETFRAADAVGRLGGDEFLVVVAPGSDPSAAARRLAARVENWCDAEARYVIRTSIGIGHVAGASIEGFWEAVDAADRRMYADKQARRADRGHRGAGALVPALS